MMEELLDEYPGRDVEIWYSPTRRHDPLRNDFIGAAGTGIAFVPVRDADIKDLRAYEAVKYDETGYVQEVADIGGMKWDEYADEDGTVSVLWLSNKSYRILTDPDISRVSAISPRLIRKYDEFIAVQLQWGKDRHEGNDWNEDSHYEKDDELEMLEPRVRAEIIPLTECNLDQLWAEEFYFVGENELHDLPFELNLNWMGEESFEEHYGHPNAKILVAACI